MGLIVVMLIIASVLWKNACISALCLIVLSIVIMVRKQLQKWIVIFIAAFFIPFYFYSTYDFNRPSVPFEFEPKERHNINIRFSDDLKIDGNLLMGSLSIHHQNYQFFYKIKNEDEQKLLKQMHLSFLVCSAQITKQHVLPNTNFSGFHYDAFLYHHHKVGSLKLSNVDWLQCHTSTLNIIEQIQSYRKHLVLKINQSNLQHKGYFIALTLGDTNDLNKDEMNVLKTLGIYHLYAISGSHVALISVQLYFVLRRCNVPLVFCKSLLLAMLPMYMIFTGGQPSVFRSTIFILLILFNPLRHIQLVDMLSLTFIINLLYDPFAIFDIGFQLSYIICFSFILILPLYQERSGIFQFFLINLISQCATIPILLYHFNNNYFIGVVTNIFFIPLFTLVIFPICTIALICFMIGFQSFLINGIVNHAFWLNDVLTTFFVRLSRFEIVVGHQQMLMYILLIVSVFFCFSKRKLIRSLSIVCVIIFFLISDREVRDIVHFLDVGQGDAFILELGHDTVMIDTGGKLDFSKPWEQRLNAQSISDKVTIPFLKHRGIDKINTLILTHPDADHFGETEHLIEANMIEKIILNPKAHGNEKYQQIIQKAKLSGIKLIDVTTLIEKDNIHLMHHEMVNNINQYRNVELEFLNAGQTGEENNDSIVVLLKYAKPGRNILFLADLGKDYEDDILNQIKEPIDIVKIGHHGSRTSTSNALLQSNLKLGIISAGRHNRFQHPHSETIDKLKQSGINVLNTQKEGRISIDLESGSVSTQYQSLFFDK